MNARVVRFLLPFTLGVAVAAQENNPVETSIWSGVYTPDQAVRGQDNFENNCSECHLSDLSGRAGPALKGDTFMERWRGKTVGSLFDKIKTTMPADRRTQLDDARTLDLVAFLLQQNGFAPGNHRLNTDAAGRIRIEDQRDR